MLFFIYPIVKQEKICYNIYTSRAIALEKEVISFLVDKIIPMVLFKSRRSSEKCIKKRRKSLCHKDFGVISFSAARYIL